jgi:hypothetical protein
MQVETIKHSTTPARGSITSAISWYSRMFPALLFLERNPPTHLE